MKSATALLQLCWAASAASAVRKTFFILSRMLPVFCSSERIVARNSGPSSLVAGSSPGLHVATSTFTGPEPPTVDAVIVGTKLRPFSGIGSNVGEEGSLGSL